MLSLNAYVYPGSGNTAASFPAPLMDCTSAIHNSDNIQNSTPYCTGRKTAAVAFQERLKGIPIVIAEKQPSRRPLRHTNDPYRRTSTDGSSCVPQSPFTTEMSFLMSYREEDVGSTDASLATPLHPALTTVPTQNNNNNNNNNNNHNYKHNINNNNTNIHHSNNGTVRSAAFTSCLPPAPRSAASTTFKHRPSPFTAAIGTPTAFRQNNSNSNTVDVNVPAYNSPKRGESRSVKNHSTTHSQSGNSSVPSTSTGTTSVTHVRCKRVYVNGRPVTVWLNDEQLQ
ncbi:hypothetical protein LSM04_003312 [Trypanosoma melophagium]|uniref:uncharacterized protein n=1 Tax=Trypanosoma melophagium TaxID=715481 RepID=UPI00351A5EB7|nr:hypothetical protein LSM04_003312 [Trypanosoma melophagium]